MTATRNLPPAPAPGAVLPPAAPASPFSSPSRFPSDRRPAAPGRRLQAWPAGWWDSPRRLGLAATVVVLTAAGALTAGWQLTGQTAAAVRAVGQDSAPSIVTAQHLRAACADLDANQFNLLLTRPGSAAARAAQEACRRRRDEIAQNLVDAAKNITYGEAERRPLIILAGDTARHDAALAQALAWQEAGDSVRARAAARQAAALLAERVLPAADALSEANAQVLKRVYADHGRQVGGAWALTLGATLLWVGVLVAAQVYLARLTGRLLNAGLLAATALALLAGVQTLARVGAASGQLRVATEDAFGSVQALWQAKALAYQANGEESRWLYDGEDGTRAAESARRFEALSRRIAQAPAGASPAQLATAAAAEGWQPPAGFQGLLADELRNVTFPGERALAAAALHTFGAYLDVDRQIRQQAAAGRHDQAVELCLSTAPGGSNRAFDDFDAVLDQVIDLNQREFDRAIVRAQGSLAGGNRLAAATVLAAAALAVAGLWPRMREYA